METKWKMMGMSKTLTERFSVMSPTHWRWEPRLFGMAIVDDFELAGSGDRSTTLTITSQATAQGLRGRIAQMMMGGYLDRIMVEEWDSADEAFRKEAGLKLAVK